MVELMAQQGGCKTPQNEDISMGKLEKNSQFILLISQIIIQSSM